jgi:predicted transcriptional regulator
MATRREKLTVELEPELRDSLTRRAVEEDRPVGNLMRRLLAMSVEQHERQAAAVQK